jgi:hypothetical protein
MDYFMKIQLGPDGANGKTQVKLNAPDRASAEAEAADIGKSLSSMVDWWVEGQEA